ncbi:MAG: endonuclease III [Fimbriimonadia bacterium]
MTRRRKDIRRIVEHLEVLYGRAAHRPRFDPVEELICCILSQHSADVNSFPAFTRLRARYPEWQQVLDAPVEEVAETIRRAGMHNQKSERIRQVLARIYEETGGFSLDHLRTMPWPEARKWLMSLPGVGPKTAAIVLCFTMGQPVIPVDTHVFRVGWRIGFYDKKIGEAKAHDVLQAAVPEDLAYRFHTTLIQHGRNLCRARDPECAACPIRSMCDFGRENRPPGVTSRRTRASKGQSSKGGPHD